MKKILLGCFVFVLVLLCACGAPANAETTTAERRAATVGIDLAIDSDNSIAEANAVAEALCARLGEAYPEVDFVVAVNGTPALETSDTIAVPVNGIITPENRAALLDEAAVQVSAQLEKWGYESAVAAATSTTGATTKTAPSISAVAATIKPTATTTQKVTIMTKKNETSLSASQYPETWTNPHVDLIVPQGVSEFNRSFDYNRFTDSPSFAITNNQGKQLIIKLRRADPNKPEESYADIYTDENGDDIWEWRQALQGRVSSDEQLGAWEGMFQVLLDSNYSSHSSTGASIPIIDIYWIKEDNRARIRGGLVKKLSDSDYQRLQSAGSGLHVFRGVNDSTPAIYYK
ncbi:MAG: hypothetical protein LBG83_01085 [Oscillospiraceae bacterium]|nr:hypothetical protein [Oscillospiraceae bacterium]